MEKGQKSSAGLEDSWGSRDFIERWSERSERERSIREMQMKTVVFMIPHPPDESIRILDIGAGYGALAGAILEDRPKATALCLDASEEMIKMGRERSARFDGRMEFLRGSLDAADWCASLKGSFDAVVSARALHHLTLEQRRRLFRDVHGLLRPAGCFMNADSLKTPSEALRAHYRRTRKRWIDQFPDEGEGARQSEEEGQPSRNRLPHGPHYNGLLEEELDGLRQAGFEGVDCFWKFTTYAVYGGFR